MAKESKRKVKEISYPSPKYVSSDDEVSLLNVTGIMRWSYWISSTFVVLCG
jgi:hypothetical protein